MKFFILGVLSAICLLGLNSCASTENVSTEAAPKTISVFPSWYQNIEFSTDSLTYTGFATAIAADSAKAIERAEMQARIHLEKQIAQLTEEVRTDMEKLGSDAANNTDFIIILRTAHSAVVEAAKLNESVSKKNDHYYRGFAAVVISKTAVKNVLEKGFTGHPRYWGEFSSAPLFVKYF